MKRVKYEKGQSMKEPKECHAMDDGGIRQHQKEGNLVRTKTKNCSLGSRGTTQTVKVLAKRTKTTEEGSGKWERARIRESRVDKHWS